MTQAQRRYSWSRTLQETLLFIVAPAAVFYIASGLDWRFLLASPCAWAVGFAHGALSDRR